MSNFQVNPLKLYIQDIFRAERTQENKYIYEIFGLKFKNIMIHGVITAVYNKTDHSTNLELSDPTGSVQIYYDSNKTNFFPNTETLKDLNYEYAKVSMFRDENLPIMTTLMNAIVKKRSNRVNFEEGNHISVIGDIFLDDLRKIRMVSGYKVCLTSVEYDVVWLEELQYLYEKFYLWKKQE